MLVLKNMYRYRFIFSIKNYILISLCIFQCSAYANNTELLTVSNELLSKAKAEGRIKVIVNLKKVGDLSMDSTKKLSNKNRLASISKVQDKVLKRLNENKEKPLEVTKYRFTPQLALSVTETDLKSLAHDSRVASISEDALLQGTLGESVPKIFPSYKNPNAYSGAGWAVAILDTGIDKSHPAFGSRVISEACYSSHARDKQGRRRGNYYSLCPGNTYSKIFQNGNIDTGIPTSVGEGAGVDCRGQLDILRTFLNIPNTSENITGTGCSHGTGVAGIAVGGQFSGVQGVASKADIISIQVATAVHSDNDTENDPSDDQLSTVAFTSDILKGLQRVLELSQNGMKIAAVNLSYGGLDNPESLKNGSLPKRVVTSKAECEAALDPNRIPEQAPFRALRPAIQELKQVGIATVISAGNNDVTNGVGSFACIEEAITVGASNDNDERWDTCFNSHTFQPSRHRNPPYHIDKGVLTTRNCGSNSGNLIDLWAPGVDIVTAKAGGGTEQNKGTSEAAPHVAGAWAVMKESNPNATVDEIEMAFKSTGKEVTESGSNETLFGKRIDIDKALTVMAGGSCQSNLGLTPDQWTMISLPCIPPSNKNTVQDIFGDDGLGEYDTHWVVYSYDNGSNPSAYKKEGLSAVLGQGKGYWILTTTKNATVDMPEGSLDTPNLVSSNSQACMSRKGCFEIPIATKGSKLEWNLLGNPYLFPDTKLSEVRIVTDVATAPNNCADANGCTLDEAKLDGIFHNKLWSWTYSGKPATGKYLMLSPANSMKPWMGAWAASLKNATGTNPRLLIPNKAP